MKCILLSALGLLALGTAALAQVNTVPQVGVSSGIIKQNTYSAVSIGLVPASAATDIFCISGSASKTISIKRMSISGTAGTLVTAPFTLLRRASLNTGGTAAVTTALPVAATNLSSDLAATAVLIAYTANPTIVDASPLYFRTATLSLNTTAALVAQPRLIWEFGEAVGEFSRGLDILKNTAQQICINLNATTVTTGLINIDITWVEN